MKQLLQFWPIILVVLNALTAWAAWSLRQLARNEIERANVKLSAEDARLDGLIDGHDTRLTRVEDRVTGVESDIDNLPTKADLARVEGEVKTVGQEVGAAVRGITRIEGFFIKRGVENA